MRRRIDLREIARLRLDRVRSVLSPDEAEEIERLRKQGSIVVQVPGCSVIIPKYMDERPAS